MVNTIINKEIIIDTYLVLCPSGGVRLEERVEIILDNGTYITLGRPELCHSGIYVPICQSSVTPDLAQRVCHHFTYFNS